MGKGKVLLSKPQVEKAHRAEDRLQRARGIKLGGLTEEHIFRARSIAHHVNYLS
jgi:hypothetical protein